MFRRGSTTRRLNSSSRMCIRTPPSAIRIRSTVSKIRSKECRRAFNNIEWPMTAWKLIPLIASSWTESNKFPTMKMRWAHRVAQCLWTRRSSMRATTRSARLAAEMQKKKSLLRWWSQAKKSRLSEILDRLCSICYNTQHINSYWKKSQNIGRQKKSSIWSLSSKSSRSSKNNHCLGPNSLCHWLTLWRFKNTKKAKRFTLWMKLKSGISWLFAAKYNWFRRIRRE